MLDDALDGAGVARREWPLGVLLDATPGAAPRDMSGISVISKSAWQCAPDPSLCAASAAGSSGSASSSAPPVAPGGSAPLCGKERRILAVRAHVWKFEFPERNTATRRNANVLLCLNQNRINSSPLTSCFESAMRLTQTRVNTSHPGLRRFAADAAAERRGTGFAARRLLVRLQNKQGGCQRRQICVLKTN